VLTDAIEVAVAVAGMGMVVLAVKQARAKGWAASLQLAASGFFLMGAAAVGIVDFVVGLVFSPLAWLGMGLLAVAGVLFTIGQKLEGGSSSAKAEQVTGSKTKSIPSASKQRTGSRSTGDPELDDIEAILRRHGIQ
jgi:hypothetical protein